MKNLIKECKENALQAIQDYSENQNLPENWVTRNEYQRGIAFACSEIMKTINQITLEKYNLYRQTAMGSMKDRYIHDMRNMVTREVNEAIENLIEKGSQRETAELENIKDIMEVSEELGLSIIQTLAWSQEAIKRDSKEQIKADMIGWLYSDTGRKYDEKS